MAQDAGDFQPNRATAGKCQLDDPLRREIAQRQQREELLPSRQIDPAQLHLDHSIDHQGRLYPCALAGLPAITIGHQDETLIDGLEAHVGGQDQCILEAGRQDDEIRGVLGAQTQWAGAAGRGPPGQLPSLSMVAPQAESLASSRS